MSKTDSDRYMKNEKQFNTWLRKQFYEHSNKKVCVQRIENTTTNGTFDILVILSDKTLFIESKYQTERLRPEQYAFQIRTNGIIKNNVTNFLTLSAYPKKNMFVLHQYNASSITSDRFIPYKREEYELSKTGFQEFMESL